MGNIFSNNIQNDEVQSLRNRLEMVERRQKLAAEGQRLAEEGQRLAEEGQRKAEGTYWNCLEFIWGKKLVEFEGYFDKYKGIRKDDATQHYSDLRCMLEEGPGIETVLENLKARMGGSVYYVEFSVTTRETDNESITKREESGHTRSHGKKHLKTIQGLRTVKTNKSKAHLLPNDKNCNVFWLPELEMVVGRDVNYDSKKLEDVIEEVMEWAVRIHTNKLVFGMKHNHYFDDLEYGNILAIPLYESFQDVGNWRYQQAYDMLIVCDSSATYDIIHIKGSEQHVGMATREDFKCATTILSEATKILADSLHTNWGYYDKAGNKSDGSKQRMEIMREMKQELSKNFGKVYVPTSKLGDSEDPRLYKVQFGGLFEDDEGKKYIPDPLLLLIKAAVNLSAHHYSKTCMLLPACMSVSSEESEVPLLTLQSREGSSDIKMAFSEIRIVSDNEEDDNVSACSDITCLSDQ